MTSHLPALGKYSYAAFSIQKERRQYASSTFQQPRHMMRLSMALDESKQGPLGYLNITPTLDDALRRIRNATEEVVIWADAVCINQQDIPEKDRQLGIMRRIYVKASRVIAYLGEDFKCDWRNSVEDELCSKLLERLREMRIELLQDIGYDR